MVVGDVELVGVGAGECVELVDRVPIAEWVGELVAVGLVETVELGLPVLEPLGVRVGVGEGERRIATLRLRMVALATPASLASHV